MSEETLYTNTPNKFELSLDLNNYTNININYDRKTKETNIEITKNKSIKEIYIFDKEQKLRQTKGILSSNNSIVDYYKDGGIVKREFYDKNERYERTIIPKDKLTQNAFQNSFKIKGINIKEKENYISFDLFEKDRRAYNINVDFQKEEINHVYEDKEIVNEIKYDKQGKILKETLFNPITKETSEIYTLNGNNKTMQITVNKNLNEIKNIAISNDEKYRIFDRSILYKNEIIKKLLLNLEATTETEIEGWRINDIKAERLKKEGKIKLSHNKNDHNNIEI